MAFTAMEVFIGEKTLRLFMNREVFITGLGFCKEAPINIEMKRTVKTFLKVEELALAATSMALKQTGFHFNGDGGIVFGIDNAIDECKYQFFNELLADGPLGVSPLLFTYTSPNVITAQVTIAFGIKGEDITITNGPLSFLKAMGYGVELLKNGVMQSVIVGGVSKNEAMVVMLEVLTPHELRRKKERGVVLGKVMWYEDTLSDVGVTIVSIEDSFRLMENSLKGETELHIAGWILQVVV